MAMDRATKAALAAESEFTKFLDELNQYEFMKVYDNEDEVSCAFYFWLTSYDNSNIADLRSFTL